MTGGWDLRNYKERQRDRDMGSPGRFEWIGQVWAAIVIVGCALLVGYCSYRVVLAGESPPPGCDGSQGVKGYVSILPDVRC